MPILVSVVTVPIDPGVDLDTLGLAMVAFVLAAGVGWFLWRRK
jgi:LPXTG-motif cell wall-anchored protein